MYHLTLKSSNVKTGSIPVSTSSSTTCPDSCALKTKGCYAKSGPLALHWDKVSKGERGTDYQTFLSAVKSLPKRTLWRHNQAGDLIGSDNTIDSLALDQLVSANHGKRGFTYTHYPMDIESNRDAVSNANANGFTINISTESFNQIDAIKLLDSSLPLVVVLPSNAPKLQVTQAGHKVVVCPAQSSDRVTCASCKLCLISNRNYVIGFRAHGIYKNKINKLIEG